MTTPKTKKKSKSSRRTHGPRRHMFALEPRFLFDGAGAATVEQQEPAPAPEPQETQPAEPESSAALNQIQPHGAEVSESSLTDLLALGSETGGRELVVVDSAVRNPTELLKGISPDAELIYLQPGQDGIKQISEALKDRQNVRAIHILSHGTDGAVKLGNLWLQDSNLDQHADAIAGWGKALSPDADVLIYGCNVAATESGRSLVEALSDLTGADFAASENRTGHADKGGDWALEYVTGAIEAPLVITEAAQREWFGLLAPGVTVGLISGPTTEAGGTATFSVVLDEAPSADVFIPISSSDLTEGKVSTNQLVFTTLDWFTPQIVTVTGVDDSLSDSDINFTIVTGDPTSADAGYNALTAANVADVSVTNVDNDRVSGNVVALYLFDETSGNVLDKSNFGTALNLTISDPGAVSITRANGALTVFGADTDTIISSAANATKIYNALTATNEVTLEAWIQPANLTNSGPARIVTMSSNASNRDFMLSQGSATAGDGDKWSARLRTDLPTDTNGNPQLTSADGTADLSLQHVVFTRTSAGVERLYVNGVEVATQNKTGTFANWIDYPLHLMNESGGSRVLLGDLHLVAIYDRDLSLAEVQRNYSAGADVHTLVVDTTGDVLDGDTSSIGALLQNRGADGFISLREAITATNNTAGADTITFNIAGGGVHTINLSSALPFITDQVTINATTESDFAGNPLIVLNGATIPSGSNDGFRISGAAANGSVIRGFVIHGFSDDGIVITNSSNNVIAGNWIGTDATGTAVVTNGQNGIEILSGTSGNIIGGASAADRNVIAGFVENGIWITGGSSGNQVLGNYIGTNAAGDAVLGNGQEGVRIDGGSAGNQIGDVGAGNVLAGNSWGGIRLTGAGTDNNVVQANWFGTNSDGDVLGSGFGNVELDNGASNNLIGGANAGEGNIIAYADDDGIYSYNGGGSSVNNAFLGNLIFGNEIADAENNFDGIGIDLEGGTQDAYNVTANDGLDGDTGPNNLQNFPVLTAATSLGATTTVTGTLNSLANTSFRIEFFASSAADPSGYGQAERYLGFLIVTTDGSGNAAINATGLALTADGEWVTATATRTDGPVPTQYFDTSEFAQSVSVTSVVNAVDDGGSTTEDSPLSVPVSGVLVNDTLTPPAVTAGALLNYDAANDIDGTGNATWADDTAVSGRDWTFAGNVTPIAPVTAYAGITSAYDLAAAGGATNTDFGTASAGADAQDATFEFWLKPADLNDQDVLFETGGSGTGLSIFLRDSDLDTRFDDLTFAIRTGATASAVVTADLSAILGDPGDGSVITAEFIQVVAVYDRDASGATDVLSLYVNGTLVGTNNSQTLLDDWSGGNAAGLGAFNGTMSATAIAGLDPTLANYTPLEGEVALFRFYNNNALDATEVATNFAAVAQTLTVTEVNGAGANVGNPVLLASGALVTLNADGGYTYDPNGAFDSLAAGDSTIDTFTYTAADFLGASDGATVTVTINGVNDAPVLLDQAPVLDDIAQGSGAPSGAVGTLVSSLADFASPAGQVDNVTDVDSGALLGIAVTGADTANGSWWYSTDGGTSWFALGAVADNSARLLAADANTRVYFEPNPAFSGTINTAITFRAWDQTSGANGDSGVDTTTNGGTTAFSTTTDTAAITVNAPNSPPIISDEAFQQDPGTVEKFIAIEAENYDNRVSSVDDDWALNGGAPGATTAASGGGWVWSDSDNSDSYTGGGALAYASSSRLDYQVEFKEAGDYYVWIRGYTPGGAGDDSLFLGLDDAVPTYVYNHFFDIQDAGGNGAGVGVATDWNWQQARLSADGVFVPVVITDPGVHTISLYVREDNLYVDKLVFTKDATWTPTAGPPTGTGPAESAEAGTTTALVYTLGGAAEPIAPHVLVSDVDSALLQSAVIEITANYEAGQDVLAAGSLPAGISVDGSSTADRLVLTGAATLADYQEALSGVTFASTGANVLTRTITFTVNDGTDDSNFYTRDVVIASGASPTGITEITIDKTTSTFTIDGGAGEAAWAGATTYGIGNVLLDAGTQPAGAADLSGSWQALWDDTNLYILVDVTDDVLINDSANPWHDDSIEIYIDGDNLKGANYDGVNDIQYIFGWNDLAVFAPGNSPAGRTDQVGFGMVATGSGYRLETAIPWAEVFGFMTSPSGGDFIGIEVHINDDDGEGTDTDRDHKIAWINTTDISANDSGVPGEGPDSYANALLVENLSPNTPPAGNDDTYTTSEDTAFSTPAGWWDSDWGYRNTITLNNPTASALTDFPVRIRLDSSFDYASVKADGSDLRFVDADGVTVLSHEIESWNVGGESYIWVKVPNVASGGDSISIYYGNATASAPASPDVWSNGYRAVYHFGSDPGAAPGGVVDSTGNGLHGDNVGATFTTAAPPANVNGGALNFDPAVVSDHVDLGPGAYLNNVASATLAAWINPDALSGSQHIVGVTSGTSASSSRAALELAGDEIRVIAKPLDAVSGLNVTTTAADLLPGQWYHVAAVINFTTGSITVHVNGGSAAGGYSETFTGLAMSSNTDNTDSLSATLGVNENLSANPLGIPYGGLMDDVTISTVARSADEIRAYYENVTDNAAGGFVDIGAREKHGVLSNDTDSENNALTVTEVQGNSANVGVPTVTAQGGSATLNADGSFAYTPLADFSGIDTFTYTVSDGFGGSDTATVTINVTAVNDAPALDAGQTPVLGDIAQGSGAPSGAVGTLVSSLVDFASPAGQVDNVTDVDSGAVLGIAVTGADTANGTWWYSTDGGTSWFALGAVADNSARLLAADANTRVYFEPNPAFSGTIANAITFRAWDQTSGANGDAGVNTTIHGGTTAFSTASDTASISVIDSTPPVVNDQSFNYAENQGVGATVATVVFSDNVGVTAFTFTATGTTLSSDGFYQIDALGNITLTAAGAAGAANDFETGANSFVHTVTAADAAGNTDTADITLNLTNLNDNAPRIDDVVAAPLNENSANGTAVIDVNEFFTGNDTDRDGQTLNYSIIGGNTGGAFTIDLNTGAITVANSAALDFETTPVFNLTVQASDGALADTAVVTVNLSDVNEPPVNSVPGAQSVGQDTPLAFSGLNTISVSDPEGTLGSVQLTVLNGTLNVTLQGGATISGGAIGTGMLTISGSQADINATLATLVYQGSLNFSGADTLTIMSMNMPAPGNDMDVVPITVTAAGGAGGGATAASGPVGLNMPDLGWPSGIFPFAASIPQADSGRASDQLVLGQRDFVLPAVNESLRLRTLQAAQLIGAFSAADMGEIEAVSFGDGLQVEPALFVLPAVQEIRGEFDATAERAREFGTKPAPGTAPLLNDFDAYTRFLSPDGTQRDTPAPARPTDPRAANSAGDAPAAPDAAPAAAPAPGASSAPAPAEPAGAPAFSAQLRTAAALRTQVDAQLLASLRALRKS